MIPAKNGPRKNGPREKWSPENWSPAQRPPHDFLFPSIGFVSNIPRSHHDAQRPPHDFLFPSFGFVCHIFLVTILPGINFPGIIFPGIISPGFAPLDPAKRSHRVYFSNVIHDSSIFHPNNLKFWEKLLTYMNNFPTGSFLYVKLLPILFVGKVRKTRTTAGYNLLLNIYEKSTI